MIVADEQSLSGILIPTQPTLGFEVTPKVYVDAQVGKMATSTYLITTVSRTSTTALTATSLAITSLPVGQYALEGTLFYTGAAAGDMAISFTPTNIQTGSGSYWSLFGAAAATTTATGNTYEVTARAFTGSQIVGCTGAAATCTIVGGFYVQTASGGFTMNMAQGTSSTTATTLLGGSWLTASYLGV